MVAPRTAEFTDVGGVAIVYDVYEADGEARGVVQLLHGVGEHAGRYAALIEALTGAGFHVYADDHRGHGRTGIRQHGGPAKLGHLGRGGMRAVIAGCQQLTAIIRTERPGLPLVLLGHSWGSFLAQMLFNQHPEHFSAVVLSGSAYRTPADLNAAPPNARWKGDDATGLEWLSRDPAVWQEFRDDPLTVETPLLQLFGPIEAARMYGRPRKDLGCDVPVLLMVGRDDPVGGPRSVHKLADAYRNRSGLTDVTTLVYADARHEIFNELQQDEVRADLLAWLDKHVPSAT
ncbi:Lysophospholipase; Monoglyceride lipase; putative [Microbacterium esteraromaticum]|uniref:Lysophospholipase Monoglyceride lipase putative n=1 Tax=Microbacterium esteraromaticum TaxID=57043 RepID=A0A1R4KQP5_9MICO|nr:alpha/beta hydrolase [Microbacterium esteraromaticum]SJN46716.1 Lysophospholipase; Monoglyceride lipase; putative [Microbacterium esteraromaticum]